MYLHLYLPAYIGKQYGRNSVFNCSRESQEGASALVCWTTSDFTCLCMSRSCFGEAQSATQRRNEDWWRPGQGTSLAPPMFEPEVFRKQMYCIEESTSDIIGTFQRPCSHLTPLAVIWRPHSDSAPRELRPPYPPRYATAYEQQLIS